MENQNKVAFKEWAIILHAILHEGQRIILRKGGIHERKGKFEVEHERFFLFPTFEHQDEKSLKPKIWPALNSIESNSHISEIPIELYLEVRKIVYLKDEKFIPQISNFHVWADGEIQKRFHYGKEKGLYLLIVKPYRLKRPTLIPYLQRYAGCRTWVELENEIDLTDIVALETDQKLTDLIHEIELKLN